MITKINFPKFTSVLVISLSVLFLSMPAFADGNLKPGFVILQNGDTLRGEILYRGDQLMGQVCVFNPDGDQQPTEYTPFDIRGYRFEGDRYFVSRQLDNKMVFLEYLVAGKLNVYYLRDETGDRYFVEKEDQPLIELPYKQMLVNNSDENKNYEWNSTKHIAILKSLTADAPKVQNKISGMPKPNHRSLIKIAKDYQAEVSPEQNCMVFKEHTSGFKVDIELVGGNFHLTAYDQYEKRDRLNAGVMLHFNAQRVNEKLYLMTGLLFAQIPMDEIRESDFKIPFHLEYITPKGIVRPRFSIGLNVYKPFFLNLAATGGVNVKITNHLLISAWGEYEIQPTYFDSEWQPIGYYLTMGIVYKW